MEKLDLKRALRHLYSPPASRPHIVEVPEFQMIAVDGIVEKGQSPGDSPQFQAGIQALYSVSFTLKFTSKMRRENPVDYSVMPLEALWWTKSGRFSVPMSEPWSFQLFIVQPDHVTEEMFQAAIEKVKAKKDGPEVDGLRFERLNEGESVQIMHIGPYSEEAKTIESMHAFAREQGFELRGKHHEIYLSDPSRTSSERLKTILRQPIKKVD